MENSSERVFLENQIKSLGGLEPQALARLKEARRLYYEARKEYAAAKEDLDSIRGCRKEFAWQLKHFDSGKQEMALKHSGHDVPLFEHVL